MHEFISGCNHKSFRKHFIFRNDLGKDPETLEKPGKGKSNSKGKGKSKFKAKGKSKFKNKGKGRGKGKGSNG